MYTRTHTYIHTHIHTHTHASKNVHTHEIALALALALALARALSLFGVRLICMPYSSYALLIRTPCVHDVQRQLAHKSLKHSDRPMYIYPLYACHICTPCMHALYVRLACMPYSGGWHEGPKHQRRARACLWLQPRAGGLRLCCRGA